MGSQIAQPTKSHAGRPSETAGAAVTAAPISSRHILEPGRNCWRIANAHRAAVLVDADEYYRRLHQLLCKAQRSILIIGWDFDAAISLCPDRNGPEARPLGRLLRSLVEDRPGLTVRILIWSVAVIHAPGDPVPLLFGDEWQRHPRISLHLDTRHPIYGAHHQKLVIIDDAVAFCGGMDLTVRRWDTSNHHAVNPLRIDRGGSPYGPVHDIQMIIDGEAAVALAELAGNRWLTAMGEELTVRPGAGDWWPDDLVPDFTDIAIGISRTASAWGADRGAAEVAALTVDAIAAAERSIYIEAQYLSAPRIGDILAEKLARRSGPEIIILVTRSSRGLMERLIMGGNRDRLICRLLTLDGSHRMRVYYPVVPGGDGECQVLVHSKLMIIDDHLLRIGSANLNNRSMGLDSECDLAIEADTDEVRCAIAGVRWRLLAEHIDAAPEQLARTVAAKGLLIAAVEALNHRPRGLRPFEVARKGPCHPILGTRLFDPPRPFEPLWFLRWRRDATAGWPKGACSGRR